MSIAHRHVSLRSPIVTLAAGALLAACKGEQGGATASTGQPAVATDASAGAPGGSRQGSTSAAGTSGAPGAGGMQGMSGMSGMSGMRGMGGGEMMAQMRTHMRMMQGAGGDSLKRMLPMHRQMVANMIAQMNGEMRGMQMTADARWTATADSLRQDLVRMPEMSGAELRAMMPAHLGRVERFTAMHRAMMGRGGPADSPAAPGRPGA